METIRLEAGGDSALVDLLAGGRLTSLVIAGRERLIGTPEEHETIAGVSWGSFLMAPWVGRMHEARLDWGGRTVTLPANDSVHAIHGAVFDMPCEVVASSPGEVRMGHRFQPARWPFAGRIEQTIALTPGRLEMQAVIHADEAMPVAVGWHPWFAHSPDGPTRLRVRAWDVLETSGDLIPSGRVLPVAGPTDLRDGPELGDRRLDHTYVGVVSPATIWWPDLEMELSTIPGGTVVVYTPARAFCVEPQSAWPDALRLSADHADTGLLVVPPGRPASFSTTWTWSARNGSGAAVVR